MAHKLSPEGEELVAIICDPRIKRCGPAGPRYKRRSAPAPQGTHPRTVAHLRVGSIVRTNRRTYDAHGNVLSNWTDVRVDRVKLVTDEGGNEQFLVTFAARTTTTVEGTEVILDPAATLRYAPTETLNVVN